MPEPHLNGGYYGPSIPPPSKSYHHQSRGGSSCNPCSCLCNCFFRLIFTLLIIVGILALVIWLVLRPNKVNFYVDDVALTQFDFSSTNNTLYYDLALNMTIRNPNKRIGFYYDSIEATGSYKGQRFASTSLETFYQGHKSTNYLNPVFKGQNLVLLGDHEKTEYTNEKNSGVYEIDVKLYLRIRLKIAGIKSRKVKPEIECDLKVPMDSNGRASANFQRTKCDLDW